MAKAYSNLGDNINIDYVKLKRPMFTGYYTKINGHKGHRIITPKGTIMQVLSYSDNTVGLSYGLISYQKQQHIYKPTHPADYNTPHYNTKYFTPYKLKLPVRNLPLQSGREYTNSKTDNYKPIFYITMDGYLQYYSHARLKHYDVKNIFESKSSAQYENPLWRIKPTANIKVNHYKIIGKLPMCIIRGLSKVLRRRKFQRNIIVWLSKEELTNLKRGVVGMKRSLSGGQPTVLEIIRSISFVRWKPITKRCFHLFNLEIQVYRLL
ncbi:hypothetical protein [Lentilactobacillus otakiensis]|uniref:hypothetical protein n=1 Tax=Lentilactobacillus otakiensis TaxID=481720 RepID=UPI001CBCDC1A|nr:hypothetical protein [Lentilactobacillus otakiensis]